MPVRIPRAPPGRACVCACFLLCISGVGHSSVLSPCPGNELESADPRVTLGLGR